MVIGKKLRLSIPHSKTSLHWVDQGVLVSYVNHLQFVDQSAFWRERVVLGLVLIMNLWLYDNFIPEEVTIALRRATNRQV